MRFVFLTQGYHPDIDGGAYRYAAEVAEVLAARGHEVHALAKNPKNALSASETRAGVRLRRLAETPGSFRRNWRQVNTAARAALAELLADPVPTLVASHHAYFEPALRGGPFVTFFHGPWGLEHRFACQAAPRPWFRRVRDALVCRALHRIEAHELRSTERILITSQYIAGKLRGWHPSTTAPVEVVGGGANFARFQPAANRMQFRREAGLDKGDFLLLAVRRLDPRMGLLDLVSAFARVAGEFPQARLWLAGRGPQQGELQARIQAAGLGARARLLGFVPEENLPGLLGAADCVLMPSLDLEGFGLVTAEALACGTPVLASRAGANAEVVTPLDERLLFDAGSVESLAGKLADVLSGRLPLPARERCAAHAREHFRWDRPADAFERAHAEFALPGGGR